MFSFSTPCLRWKLVMAIKGQYGWPGFIAPYANRYLTKLVVVRTTPTFGYGTPDQAPTDTRQQLWQLDRLTGARSFPVNPSDAQADADFPYTQTLSRDPVHQETWDVRETHFKHVYNNGEFFVETEVTLSQPYDLATLDADADTLIASVSVAKMPWNTIQVARADEISEPIGPYTPTADLLDLLPPQVIYDIFGDGPIPAPQLNAAAWYIYAPGYVFAGDWFPNGYAKLIGYIAMAGDYCRKTYTIDYNQTLINQTCVSGKGSCQNAFKVTPPSPIIPGHDPYVLLIPNCRCGG